MYTRGQFAVIGNVGRKALRLYEEAGILIPACVNEENGYHYYEPQQLADLEKIKADIAERDHRDMTREVSPLKQAEDAVLVDSSELGIDQVTETILNLAAKKLGRPCVITAATAGFCFGVQNAVDTVYKEIEKNQDGPINTFGPIIHNENVVEELKEKGVGILNSVEEAGSQKSGTIIIRSHGVAKETWEDLNRTGARVVDTTCTFVKKIHEIVHKASEEGKQIVIIGNHGHAETEGTVGWTSTPSTVIETEEEARKYRADPDRIVCIVAQTTFNAEKFEKFVDLIVDACRKFDGWEVHIDE